MTTGYVIRRTDGAFVARPGSRGSYTASLQEARIFKSLEMAKRERCPENEMIYTIEECLQP
jgi:hypothetical protein